MSCNKVFLLGFLGKDPVLKYTQTGVPVCSFSLATSEKWRDKSGTTQERTEWHNVVTWNKAAEIASQYLKKGSQCLIEGKLSNRSYEDKSGVKKYTTEVIAESLQLVDKAGTKQEVKPDEYAL
jgi:single-strand DNA-binding protein